MKVAIYVRERSTRQYKPASPRILYSPNTIFCLRYTERGVRTFEQIEAQTYKEAQAASLKKLSELIANQSKPIGAVIHKTFNLPDPKPRPVPVLTDAKPLKLDAAIDKYIENVQTKSAKTSTGYRYTLQQFYASSGNLALSQVTTQHLYDFVGYLRREELGDRTVHNRVAEVVTFLRHFGIKEVKLRVKFVEQKVRAYRLDELKSLFAAAKPEEWMVFQFFLCTGAREQEVMNAEWGDLDLIDNIYTVTAKEGWNPKDFAEREIPIPDFLVAKLKERKLKSKSNLIFPTAKNKLDGHMLRKLKALAKRAGLDPTTCKLHTFRKSYATLQHRNGVDARTIQLRLGHEDIETTLSYLEGEASRSKKSQQQVNSTFGSFGVQSQYATQ